MQKGLWHSLLLTDVRSLPSCSCGVAPEVGDSETNQRGLHPLSFQEALVFLWPLLPFLKGMWPGLRREVMGMFSQDLSRNPQFLQGVSLTNYER